MSSFFFCKNKLGRRCRAFLFWGSPEATASHTHRTMSEGRCSPTNSHAGRPSQQQKLPQGAPGSYSQDTASGTSPTWPPAPSSTDCTLYTTPLKDLKKPAPPIKRTSSSNPSRGLSEAVPQGSTTQHFGLFIPRHWTLSAPSHWSLASGEPRASSTGTLPLPWKPQQVVPRVAQSILGPA